MSLSLSTESTHSSQLPEIKHEDKLLDKELGEVQSMNSTKVSEDITKSVSLPNLHMQCVKLHPTSLYST